MKILLHRNIPAPSTHQVAATIYLFEAQIPNRSKQSEGMARIETGRIPHGLSQHPLEILHFPPKFNGGDIYFKLIEPFFSNLHKALGIFFIWAKK